MSWSIAAGDDRATAQTPHPAVSASPPALEPAGKRVAGHDAGPTAGAVAEAKRRECGRAPGRQGHSHLQSQKAAVETRRRQIAGRTPGHAGLNAPRDQQTGGAASPQPPWHCAARRERQESASAVSFGKPDAGKATRPRIVVGRASTFHPKRIAVHPIVSPRSIGAQARHASRKAAPATLGYGFG